MNLPTLVIVRRPPDTVLSLTSRWPFVTVQQALRNYALFYEKIEPYTHGFVLSPFDQTTGHLDRVIREVNSRFGTDFDLFEHTKENVRALRGSSNGKPEKAAHREKLNHYRLQVGGFDSC